MRIRSIRDLEIERKKLFLRLDLNVPLSEPDSDGHRKVEEDYRIREALPTIKHAIERGARVILASHLGRPKGQRNPEFSLEPVAECLAQLLDQDVTLSHDCVGEGVELMVSSLPQGKILLLENLRFHPEEEKNDLEFAQKMARLCDVFVMDAFGAAHRAHASTQKLPSLMKDRGMGFLMEKEVDFLGRLLGQPEKPFYLLLGGAKVSDKIKTLKTLLRQVHGVVVGGAMAFAFEAAKGKTIPESAKKPSPEDVEAAREIISDCERRAIPLLLPLDWVETFDIGEKTVKAYLDFLSKAKTIFWNGPMGWFEKAPYDQGTNAIALGLSQMSALRVVGGGDTVLAVKRAGVSELFDHLSTGGGAALEFLEGDSLPGIDVLKE